MIHYVIEGVALSGKRTVLKTLADLDPKAKWQNWQCNLAPDSVLYLPGGLRWADEDRMQGEAYRLNNRGTFLGRLHEASSVMALMRAKNLRVTKCIHDGGLLESMAVNIPELPFKTSLKMIEFALYDNLPAKIAILQVDKNALYDRIDSLDSWPKNHKKEDLVEWLLTIQDYILSISERLKDLDWPTELKMIDARQPVERIAKEAADFFKVTISNDEVA